MPFVSKAKLQHLQGSELLAARLQHLIDDVLSNSGEINGDDRITSNKYRTYDAQVQALDRKYRSEDDWGCAQVQNVIAIRSAFQIGDGIHPTSVDAQELGEKEQEFINDFMQYNNIDEELPQALAAEAEIEGKLCIVLRYIPQDDMVAIRHLSWSQHKYKVITDPNDYMSVRQIKYRVNTTGSEVVLTAPYFVFAKFGGRLSEMEKTTPKLAPVLSNFENLDKSIYDWRTINKLFGSPTPYFQCETPAQVEETLTNLERTNFTIGKAFAGVGTFTLVTLPTDAIGSLEKEIMSNMKIISSQSGVTVHFLGLPELLSNRSTADNLMDLTVTSTNRDRKVYKGFWQQIIRNAMMIMNEVGAGSRRGLKPETVDVDVPMIAAQKMKEIVDIYLPLATAGMLSKRTLLSKVPEIDPDEEMKLLEEQQKAQPNPLQNYIDRLGGDNEDAAPTDDGEDDTANAKGATQ